MEWRKSSLSVRREECVEVAAAWRTSSLSVRRDECVEVAPGTDILVRDSKAPGDGLLAFERSAWTAFVADLEHHGRSA